MLDESSSADALLPPWAHAFVRQLTPTSSTPSQGESSEPTEQVNIATEQDLEDYLWAAFAVRIPKVRVCAHHQAPWEAFCCAFFAKAPVIVIKGSRGLAGKSWLMALLGTVLATVLKADVTILGGSGAQSTRVHKAMNKFWSAPNAPRHLLRSDPGVRVTKFRDGNEIEALMASQASVRGPHPQRLILDEVDEMDLKIFEASMGQTLAARGIAAQTTIGSTHQHPDGTMTKVLKLAVERGWPVFEWCWRETVEPHGWLEPSEVARKRSEMTTEMWNVEVELGEPSAEGRAIPTEFVERMFMGAAIKSGVEPEFPYAELEKPEDGAYYLTGADWARTRDFVAIATFRKDVYPMRLVAYQQFRKKPTPYILAKFDHQLSRYPGEAFHDSTSLGGKIMGDFVEDDAGTVTGMDFGKRLLRQNMFTNYILAIEQEEVVAPKVQVLYDQHKYVRNDDLRPGGQGHPPDGFVACALAYQGVELGATMRLTSGLAADAKRKQAVEQEQAVAPTGLRKALAFLGGKTGGNGHGANGGGHGG